MTTLITVAKETKSILARIAVSTVASVLIIKTFRSDNNYDFDYEIRTGEAGTRL